MFTSSEPHCVNTGDSFCLLSFCFLVVSGVSPPRPAATSGCLLSISGSSRFFLPACIWRFLGVSQFRRSFSFLLRSKRALVTLQFRLQLCYASQAGVHPLNWAYGLLFLQLPVFLFFDFRRMKYANEHTILFFACSRGEKFDARPFR